jgi:hypothetical protein
MLAGSVTNGRHISLEGVGHYVRHERPQVVIDAVRQVLDTVQQGPGVR